MPFEISETLSSLRVILLHIGLTLMFVGWAGIFVIEWYAGLRGTYMLLGVFALLCLALFFFFLSVSNADRPIIPRISLMPSLRVIQLLILVGGTAWWIARVRKHVSVDWRDKPAEGQS